MSADSSRPPATAVIASLAIGVILAMAVPARSQTWPPLSEEERTMTDCAQQPGAEAVWLYREMITSHGSFETKFFKRLKILKDSGRDRANVEIPYYAGIQKVEGLEIRHIPAKGEPRPFAGQVFDKTALRYKRFRVGLKTFAVPDVGVGSIIEFRYKIVPDYGGSSGSDDEDLADNLQLAGGKPEEGGLPRNQDYLSFPAIRWELQDDLFTRRARFEFTTHPRISVLFGGRCQVSWVSHKVEGANPHLKGNGLELEIENVPAFVAEEEMTPVKAEQMSVDVFYQAGKIKSSDEFWKEEGRTWQKTAERFIGDPLKVASRAQELIGDSTDPTWQLKKLYEGAQKIRNLSYEKGLTRKGKKEQKIKPNRGVADVFERGYGVRSDITRAFVALARAAGFEAEAVRAVTRDDKIFRINLLSFYDQMDSELALVKLGDRTLLFDPATPFCPFALVHWSRSNTAALRYSDKPPAFFTTPAYPPDLAMTLRQIALKLDLQGGLSGTVKTTFSGHEALVRRLDHIQDDAEARKKDFEKELADALPMGAAVTLTKLENVDNSDPALVASFDVTIPGGATAAGDKILLPVSPLTGSAQYPFRHAERRYPVYFPFPFREFDDVVITLPEGLAPEVRPEGRKSDNDFSSYSLASAVEGPQRLHIQRDLIIKKSYFAVDQYQALKSFFDSVRAADEAQVVLSAAKK